VIYRIEGYPQVFERVWVGIVIGHGLVLHRREASA
jgi:hypothetical protein